LRPLQTWRAHFERFNYHQGRLVGVLRHAPSQEASTARKGRMTDRKPCMLISVRAVKHGQHELLIRLVRHQSTGASNLLDGLNLGLGLCGGHGDQTAPKSPSMVNSPATHPTIQRRSFRVLSSKWCPDTTTKDEEVRESSGNAEGNGSALATSGDDWQQVNTSLSGGLHSLNANDTTVPSEFVFIDGNLLRKALNDFTLPPSCGTATIDLVLLLVLDTQALTLKFAVELERIDEMSGGFLSQHTFFHRWSNEQSLSDDLFDGILGLPKRDQYTFAIEIDSVVLGGSEMRDRSNELEILPKAAFQRSWWVDLIGRSVDDQPRIGKKHVPEWGLPDAGPKSVRSSSQMRH